MNASTAAFTAPLPPLSRPYRSATCVRVAPRRPVNLLMREQLPPQSPNNSTVNDQRNVSNRGPAIWNGIRRLVRISALSASFILAPAFTSGMNRAPQISNSEETPITTIIARRTLGGGSSAIAATKQVSTSSTSSTSDVEAAAMTLGAVTLGGLLMRAIVSRSRDEEAERAKLATECARLEKEEQARALRAQRAKLESVEAPTDDLMSELRKRLETMNEEDSDDANSSSTDPDSKSDHMRHSPIPDRGTGSAVLDRPENSNGDHTAENQDNPNKTTQEGENLAKPDELEMLKRMWNLSPPDKE